MIIVDEVKSRAAEYIHVKNISECRGHVYGNVCVCVQAWVSIDCLYLHIFSARIYHWIASSSILLARLARAETLLASLASMHGMIQDDLTFVHGFWGCKLAFSSFPCSTFLTEPPSPQPWRTSSNKKLNLIINMLWF